MSILYCTIPHLPVGLARRDGPAPEDRPMVLVGPEGRVLDASPEAVARGVSAGQPAHAAEVRCPDARLVAADLPAVRAGLDAMCHVLERASVQVEPHGWGAAYVDLEDLARDRDQAAALCAEIGRAMRRELGPALQPALGWDSTKFTAQAAARRTLPGRLMAVAADRERSFLKPLPVSILPLDADSVQRLYFLGLRTLGQYAGLPPAAVWQQFGRAGRLAQRCARGEDDRPVIPRHQAPVREAACDFDAPLADRPLLVAALARLAAPLLAGLRANLQACGRVRLTVQFDHGGAQEHSHSFLLPVGAEDRVLRTLGQLLDGMRWESGAAGLAVALEEIQDAVPEQLALFPGENERDRGVDEARRYLASRFGAVRLRRAAMVQPGAPLPEWRVGWPADACPGDEAGEEPS